MTADDDPNAGLIIQSSTRNHADILSAPQHSSGEYNLLVIT